MELITIGVKVASVLAVSALGAMGLGYILFKLDSFIPERNTAWTFILKVSYCIISMILVGVCLTAIAFVCKYML